MNRHESMAAGKTTYDATNPCKYGHIGKRYVGSGACVGCYEARREAVKLNRMNERQTTRTWSPVATPVDLPTAVDAATIRAMNSVLPYFVPALMRAATFALAGGDMGLVSRNVDMGVVLAKRGRAPEQVYDALTATAAARGEV